MVGLAVGAWDGCKVETSDGISDGWIDGAGLGLSVLGVFVNAIALDGAVGRKVGLKVAPLLGLSVGRREGAIEGWMVGSSVGTMLGINVALLLELLLLELLLLELLLLEPLSIW
jgi:hypothetical protein